MRTLIGFKRVVFAAVAAMGFAADAAVVRYDSAATGTGDGSSWANAYTDIASAIAAVAESGGEVWVKEGTHKPTTSGFSMASNVTLLGGFNGGVYDDEAAERAARDPVAYPSVFEGNGNYIINQTSASDASAVADGVIFTKAQYGVWINVGNALITFNNCVFSNYCGISTVTSGSGCAFNSCTFDGLSSNARGYGAINIEGGGSPSVDFTDCLFTRCSTPGSFGLVQCNGRPTNFLRCRFVGNRTTNSGEIIAHNGDSFFTDCSFIGNASTNGGALTVYSYMKNCVIASNEVINTSTSDTSGGKSRLLTAGTQPPIIYGCSIFDNKVIRTNPSLIMNAAESYLIENVQWGHSVINSTLTRNVCTATVAKDSDAKAYGATVCWIDKSMGGVVNCTLVDNVCTTAELIDRHNAQNDVISVVCNSIFENEAEDYVPLMTVGTGTKGFEVFDSAIRNYDNTKFRCRKEENVTDDPCIYLAKYADGALYFPVRSGTAAAGPGRKVTRYAGNGVCTFSGASTDWTSVGGGKGTASVMPDILGNERPEDAFVYGSVQITNAEDEVAMFRAKVTPVGSGTILGAAAQDVPAGEGISAITAVAASDEIAFLGWRDVGEDECFETAATLNLASVPKDRAVEAVFGTPKVPYTFDLGAAGTFDDNGLSVIVIEYDIGDKPELPKWTQNPSYHIVGWDVELPKLVTKDPFVMTLKSIEMVHRIRRYDSAAPDGGDGLTWATAMNSMEQALAEVAQWTGEVWVKEGLHKLKEATGVSLRNNVAVRGGFAGVDGAYADDDAERAARDPSARYTALQGSGSYVLHQTNMVDTSAVVDGIAFTNTQYAYYTDAPYTRPTFTNCVFAGKAGLYGSSARSGIDVFDSRISHLSGGNNWGAIQFWGCGEACNYTRCVIEDCVGHTSYGIFNHGNGSWGVFTDCVIRNNTSAGTVISNNQGADDFFNCEIVNNVSTGTAESPWCISAREMVRCRVISNRVVRTGTSAAGLPKLVHAAGRARIQNSTFYANEVVREQPDLTSGTPSVAFAIAGDYTSQIINSTFAQNVCRVHAGEGAVGRGTMIFASGNYEFKVLNSSFVDNDVETSEFADDSRSAQYGYPCVLVNVVCRNTKAGHTPIETWSGTAKGWGVYSCILPGFDETRFNLPAKDRLLTIQPPLSRGKWIDGQLVYPLRKIPELKGFCRDATTGPNRCYSVDGGIWPVDVGPSAPKVQIGDIVGNERPSGQFTPGSYQPFSPSGIALIVR